MARPLTTTTSRRHRRDPNIGHMVAPATAQAGGVGLQRQTTASPVILYWLIFALLQHLARATVSSAFMSMIFFLLHLQPGKKISITCSFYFCSYNSNLTSWWLSIWQKTVSSTKAHLKLLRSRFPNKNRGLLRGAKWVNHYQQVAKNIAVESFYSLYTTKHDQYQTGTFFRTSLQLRRHCQDLILVTYDLMYHVTISLVSFTKSYSENDQLKRL